MSEPETDITDTKHVWGGEAQTIALLEAVGRANDRIAAEGLDDDICILVLPERSGDFTGWYRGIVMVGDAPVFSEVGPEASDAARGALDWLCLGLGLPLECWGLALDNLG
jgi:hypothetical protein